MDFAVAESKNSSPVSPGIDRQNRPKFGFRVRASLWHEENRHAWRGCESALEVISIIDERGSVGARKVSCAAAARLPTLADLSEMRKEDGHRAR